MGSLVTKLTFIKTSSNCRPFGYKKFKHETKDQISKNYHFLSRPTERDFEAHRIKAENET